MGLFSGSKKTYVSSVVYNMAGPEENRANYLKTLVISNVISDHDTSMSNTITQGYLGGPVLSYVILHDGLNRQVIQIYLDYAIVN